MRKYRHIIATTVATVGVVWVVVAILEYALSAGKPFMAVLLTDLSLRDVYVRLIVPVALLLIGILTAPRLTEWQRAAVRSRKAAAGDRPSLWFMGIPLVTILAIEAILNMVMSHTGPHDAWLAVVFHAMLLTITFLPVLYLFWFRPLAARVAERARTEASLKESEADYQQLMINIPGMVYRSHKNWSVSVISGLERICGCPEISSHFSAWNWLDVIHPDDRERVLQESCRLEDAPSEMIQEYRIVTKSGELRWVADHKHSRFSPDGQFLGVDGIVFDISDRKEAERKREQFEMKYHAMFDGAAEGIAVADIESLRFVSVNPAFSAMLGYSQEEMAALSITDIHPKPALAHVLAEFAAQARGEKTLALELPCLRKDGTIVYADVCTSPIVLDDKEHNVGYFTDVTEVKRLREFSSRAQRLEVAGRVAGQVAHDFNNLLTPLLVYPAMIRERVQLDEKTLGMLDKMTAATEKIAEINRDLLTLGRRGERHVKPLDLRDVVEATLAASDIPETVVVSTLIPKKPLPIIGNAAQLSRVISNLIGNAIDAMKGSGALALSTEQVNLERPLSGYQLIEIGEYTRLDIADTGIGIPQEVLDRIFEPFFTTKETDTQRGSGLGLSVAKSVMDDHRGYIDVHTLAGEGTTFSLYFPVDREGGERIDDDAGVIPLGTGQSVLVVDDDPILRQTAERMLDELGYDVATASSGEEAVALIAELPRDLVLLDLVMTGIDGVETLRRIKQISPQQPVLLMSGHERGARINPAELPDDCAFIPKPIRIDEMARAVHALLAPHSASRSHLPGPADRPAGTEASSVAATACPS